MTYNKHFSTGNYGLEAVIDFHGCDVAKATTENLRVFLDEVIKLSDMEAHGEPIFWVDMEATEPHLKGISVFQWIKTSNIVIHALATGLVLFNLFSCKPFDPDVIVEFGRKFWQADRVQMNVVDRGKN